MVFVVPVLLLWALIAEIKHRNKMMKFLNQGFKLKYVDFLQGRIDFCFIDPKYNFTCGYEDIESLDMNLETVLRTHKGQTFILLQEVELKFKVLNGKTFSISNTPLQPVKFLYKLIDYTRGIQNFSYQFTGAGVNDDLKERIDDYRKKGCRQILSTVQENSYKFMSLMFFAISLVFIFMFWDIIKELIGKIPCELIVAVQLITIIVLGFIICKPLIFSINDNKILNANSEFKELWVNPPSEYNNLRKDEIYSLRKAYVKDSLFDTDDYEPNERVFGQIQDYKPWWGSQKCRPLNYSGDYHESIEGESKQSIQINNPNALVGLSSPYIPWDVEENADFCNSEYSRFIPKALKYSKKDNLIVAEYEVSKEFPNIYVNISGKGYRYPIQLSGLNALDFGYKYIYAFDTKNIDMTYSDNITQTPGMFRDYIHVGGSCGYEGGCNNISPMQNDKMISVKALPAEINLKLWKKQPHDKYSKADMYYRIIFKEQ